MVAINIDGNNDFVLISLTIESLFFSFESINDPFISHLVVYPITISRCRHCYCGCEPMIVDVFVMHVVSIDVMLLMLMICLGEKMATSVEKGPSPGPSSTASIGIEKEQLEAVKTYLSRAVLAPLDADQKAFNASLTNTDNEVSFMSYR
jgi:hypothetical protein